MKRLRQLLRRSLLKHFNYPNSERRRTKTVQESEKDPSGVDTVIIADPISTPVTLPDGSTVAILSSLEDQTRVLSEA